MGLCARALSLSLGFHHSEVRRPWSSENNGAAVRVSLTVDEILCGTSINMIYFVKMGQNQLGVDQGLILTIVNIIV